MSIKKLLKALKHTILGKNGEKLKLRPGSESFCLESWFSKWYMEDPLQCKKKILNLPSFQHEKWSSNTILVIRVYTHTCICNSVYDAQMTHVEGTQCPNFLLIVCSTMDHQQIHCLKSLCYLYHVKTWRNNTTYHLYLFEHWAWHMIVVKWIPFLYINM